jgi:hypothetical protein
MGMRVAVALHMNLIARALLVAVCGSLAGGCVMPPVRVGAGETAAAGTVATIDSNGMKHEHAQEAMGDLRAAITPASLVARPSPLDVALGVALDISEPTGFERRATTIAPYAEVAWFVRDEGVEANVHRWRIAPSVLAEVPYADNTSGYGVGGGVLVELVDRVDGPMTWGSHRGYWGMGFALRGGMRHFDGDSYGYVLLTLELRAPGMAAIPVPHPSCTPGLNC